MEKKIYYHDTDCGGVVYYANYLKYLEEARTEFFENKGLSMELLKERNFLYAVRKCTISYKSPARYGDIIVCDAAIKDVTAAQFIFIQNIQDKSTGRSIAEAEVALVSLNQEFKAVPIPEDIRKQLVA